MSAPVAAVWPRCLDRPVTEKFNLSASTISPGQTASGAFALLRLDGGGLWVATKNQVLLQTDDDVRTWRALRMLAQGGAAPIVVTRRDAMLRPLPIPLPNGVLLSQFGGDPAYAPIANGDGTLNTDGTGSYQPVISAQLNAAASLRATLVVIKILQGSQLRGGECFSINHPIEGDHMYEATFINQISGDTASVTIEPPLRDDAPNGADVEFDYPRCVMRLAKPSDMDLEFATFPYPRPSVSFVEYFFNQ